ncbi:MAG TPA: DUF5615 family PIN-like protein [Thermoanaerobaculia bacterium]|nr:DUF5615 family PIN-like protein [Thermoanaerobaculia bacterium]
MTLGEQLSGSTDELLWSRVVADGRLLITLDLDFSDVRRFRPGTHPGILLIRARSWDWRRGCLVRSSSLQGSRCPLPSCLASMASSASMAWPSSGSRESGESSTISSSSPFGPCSFLC